MLTEEEAKAVERLRANDYYMSFVAPTGYAACSAAMNKCKLAERKDKQIAASAMLRLYPPGWNDPVTPERLVELGGTRVSDWEVFFPGSFPGIGLRVIQRPSGTWKVLAGEYVVIDEPASLRNMKEARELLVRCGAIKEEK